MGGGRPLSRSVSYFPHYGHASDGRTLTILENHFGLEGYAIWFKLLERVSTTENHVISCRNSENMEFLAAKLRVPPDKLTAILDKLAELEAIDPQLWAEHRVIWCQHLVDGVADVYRNRRQKQEPPQKPVFPFISAKPVSTPDKPVSTLDNGVSTPDKPVSGLKGKERKGKERKGKQPPNPQPPGPAAATIKDSLGEIATLYESNFGLLNQLIGDRLKGMLAEYGTDWTRDALTEAGTQPANKRHLNYVAAILKRWAAEGRGPPGNNGHGQQPPKGKTRVPARYTRPEELDAEDGITTSDGGSTARDRAPPVAG